MRAPENQLRVTVSAGVRLVVSTLSLRWLQLPLTKPSKSTLLRVT
jgi:hypothetical protein